MAIHCTDYEKDMYSQTDGWGSLPEYVPSIVFHTRVSNGEIFEWKDVSTWNIFAGRRVLIFSLPGAFTPTCSTYQLPNFDRQAELFYATGIEDIYCVSVNDSFVMNAWAKANEIENIKMIPDGSGKFTEEMQMLVDKDNLGFGRRSWRYACVVDNGKITDWFIEEGKTDNCPTDPYLFTNPEYILDRM